MWAVVPISDKLVQSLDKLRPGRPSFAALDLELTNAATPCVLSLSLALSFVVWTFPHTATAALNQWTARGPKGGEIDSLAIDPSHPATLYAGAFWGGVFKSTDSGVHWSQMTNGMDPLAIVRALAVDPTNSENVYAGTSSGLYTSNDGGATWSLGLYRDVQAVAVDPATPTTVYAGTCSDPDGLYKSTDGGVNWSASNSGLPTHCVDSLAVDPVSTGTIYAGTTGQLSNGVFKSTNGAASWSPSGLAQYTVFDLIVDPSNHSTIYAIGNGADKSTDGGQTWSRMSAGQYVVALALVASDPSVLYAATGSGVKGSSDGGATWAVSGPNPPSGVSVLAVNPNRSSVLFAATNLSGVYTSIRSGSSWTSTSAGLYAQEIPALAVAFGPSNAVYAGTWHGFFESFDSGATWVLQTAVPGDQPIRDAVINPANAQDVYVATDFGVYRSLDGGQTWATANTHLFDRELTSIAIDPVTPSTLYVTTVSRGVYKSTDGGDTWAHSSTGLPSGGASHIAVDPTAQSNVYVSAGNPTEVFQSSDGGATWSAAGLTPYGPIEAITVDTNGTVYVGAQYEYFLVKRARTGSSWSITASTNDADVHAILADPTNPSKLYVGTGSSGVLVSTNAGSSWTPLNSGLTELDILRLQLSPTGNTLYAGGAGGGVFDYEFS